MESHELDADRRPALPPLGVLQSALRKTTETLIREVAFPSGDAPRWNDFEWRIAEAAAVMQGISALLSNRSRWRGPQRWEAFLAGQTEHTLLRRQKIAKLLEHMHIEATLARLPAVALKGAELYGMGAYPRGDRPMSDVDLLVAPVRCGGCGGRSRLARLSTGLCLCATSHIRVARAKTCGRIWRAHREPDQDRVA